ncbi:rubis-subs-bind domain-containing protein [Haematococcus lacustris]|uniref:Rubis-subs-bind domain-containing protein n=1 Tax=Haematococcus lacustris TaxID=44745 RepID=A0A6A0ADU8_HAELA|nr:rubis-subs-bind domain-containing protein [Haematococcus lacustris]
MAVASRPLQPGDLALSIPSHLVITLDRVFESEFVGGWAMLAPGELLVGEGVQTAASPPAQQHPQLHSSGVSLTRHTRLLIWTWTRLRPPEAGPPDYLCLSQTRPLPCSAALMLGLGGNAKRLMP